jgi:hypothetical protein
MVARQVSSEGAEKLLKVLAVVYCNNRLLRGLAGA